MTREQQIKEALKLLGPPNSAERRKFVITALDDLAATKAANQRLRDLTSKEARKSLTAYRKVLLRAEVAYKRLPNGMKMTLEALGRVGGHQDINFDAQIDCCDRALLGPHPGTKKDYFKYNAAAWAKNLLDLLDIQSPLTHNGKWPKLAAILHGDASSDELFHHCSAYNASKNSGSK